MKYDTELTIKYKEIEEELLEKINNRQIGKENTKKTDLGYTEEDVLQICNELYKHELLLVFQVDNISNKRVGDTVSELWEKVKENIQFLDVIKLYKNKLSQMDLEQTFTLMFNYNLFYSLHKCIVSLLRFNNSQRESDSKSYSEPDPLLDIDKNLSELKKIINNL